MIESIHRKSISMSNLVLNQSIVFVFFIGFFLLITHGHFNHYFYPLLVTSIFLPFLKTEINIDPKRLLVFVVLLFFILFQFEGTYFRPLQIFGTDRAYLFYRNIFYFLSIIVFLVGSILKNGRHCRSSTVAAFVLMTISFFCGICASPNPIIDLYNIHEATAQAILSLENPYTVAIQSPYSPAEQKVFAPLGIHAFYLPMNYFIMAPFKFFFGDTRFSSLFFLLVFSWVVFRSLVRKGIDNETSLMFSFFLFSQPINFFCFEQGWSDPIVIGLMGLAYYFMNTRVYLASIILGVTYLTKQYSWLFLVYIFLSFEGNRRVKLRSLLIQLGVIFLVLGFFSFLDWRNFWGSLYGLNFLKDPSLKDVLLPTRLDSFSFSSWILNVTGNSYPILRIIAGGSLCLFMYLNKSAFVDNKPLALSFVYFSFLFFLAPYAYFNYFWFSISLFVIILSDLVVAHSKKFQFLTFNDLFFIFSRSFLLFVFFRPHISDVVVYDNYVDRFFNTLNLSSFEYPPLAMLFVMLPKLPLVDSPKSIHDYRVFFVLLNLIFDLLLYRSLRGKIKKSLYLFLYSCQAIILYNLVFDRLDFLLSFFMYFFITNFLDVTKLPEKKNAFRHWIHLFLGIFTKVIPIFFIPNVILLTDNIKSRMVRYKILISFIALGLVSIFWYFFDNFSYLVRYHYFRGIQVESTWNLFLVLLSKLTDEPLRIVNNYGSFNFADQSEMILFLSNFTWVALLLLFWLSIYKYKRHIRDHRQLLFETFFIVLLIIMFTFKVFSLQYLIWLFPLIYLYAQGENRNSTKHKILIWNLILLLTQIFWRDYFELFRSDTLWPILYLRNALCVAFLVLVIRDFYQKVRSEEAYS